VKFTKQFCVGGFATDYDLTYPHARCRESSFTLVARADIDQLWTMFLCDMQIGPFDVQFGPQDRSD